MPLLTAAMLAAVLPLRAQDRLDVRRYCTYDGAPLEEEVYTFAPAENAEAAVAKVMDVIGLPQHFTLLAANVPTVAAVVDGERRLLLYNTYFMERLTTSGPVDWAAWDLFVHQIAHHVHQHALDEDRKRPLDEIEADQLSGSILYKMGAPLKQAQAVLDTLTGAAARPLYPARALRLAAVTEGWTSTNESTDKKLAFAPSDLTDPGDTEGELPRFWPPPEASVSTVLPADALQPQAATATLGTVAQRLEAALDAAGYNERSYYAVPDGFALVARLEQIDPDGTSRPPPDRWSLEVRPMKKFSLTAYFKALFTASPGHFRLIAFVVTPHPFSQQGERVDAQAARAWLRAGLNTLPAALSTQPFTPQHTCTVLIYEFEQRTADHSVAFKDPSGLTARTHLEKAQLWQALTKE